MNLAIFTSPRPLQFWQLKTSKITSLFEFLIFNFAFWRYLLASKKMAGVPQLEEKLTE
jgi:hypothetical protein